MRYTGDEYSPMYRIMIHDEYGMTMRDLIRECVLVIGPNMMDLLWRYWTVLGTCSLSHTSSHHSVVLPPLRTIILDCRRERTMRGNGEEAVLFTRVSLNQCFLSFLETRKFYLQNFHLCHHRSFIRTALHSTISFAYFVMYVSTYLQM